MNGDDKARAAEAEEAARKEPGMGKALLAVFVMIVSTLVLAAIIWLVMVTIVPSGTRQPKKPEAAAQPVIYTHHSTRSIN